MSQSSRLQQRKLQHGKEMVIAVKKSSKKVILAVVIVLGILVLDAWRSGKIKWYTLDEQEMSQTASDTKSVKITKQTSSRQKKQKKVRVLLSTTGFTSLYHDKVCVSGTKGLQVRKGNHKVTYSAKEQVTFLVKEDGKDSRDKITIQPKDGGKITVIRQNGKYGIIDYSGKTVARSQCIRSNDRIGHHPIVERSHCCRKKTVFWSETVCR